MTKFSQLGLLFAHGSGQVRLGGLYEANGRYGDRERVGNPGVGLGGGDVGLYPAYRAQSQAQVRLSSGAVRPDFLGICGFA